MLKTGRKLQMSIRARTIEAVLVTGLLCALIPSQVVSALDSDPLSESNLSELEESSGTLELEKECIINLMANDPEFADGYAAMTAALQDPEKIPVVIFYRYYCGDECTRSEVWIDGQKICYSLELPDRDNKPNISCIPAGIYNCKPYSSKRFPNVWAIEDVEGRENVLIHWGNTTKDTKGCPLLGLIETENGIGESRKAVAALRTALKGCGFKLEIKKEAPPTPTPTPTPKPTPKQTKKPKALKPQ